MCFGPGERQFHADGAGGTAGTEHHNGFPGGIDEFAQRLEEALAIGVFADQFSAACDGAVHGAHDGGGFAQPVEMGDDGHLVGNGQVEPGPAHGAGALHRIGKFIRRHLAVDVAVVKTVMPIGRLDHGDSRILRRTFREGTGKLADKAAGHRLYLPFK